MVKYILFDLDGTLTDPEEGITKCVSHALSHFGIEREPGELTEFIGPPLKEHFMQYASLSDEDGKRAVEFYRQRYAPIGIFENRIYDGIIDMLNALKAQGKLLAVATSKPTVYARQICDRFGISPYIEFVSGSELDGTNTNKADVIKIAMEKLGADEDNTVMVGDRVHDLLGAQKNGIRFVGVGFGYAREGELDSALHVAASPRELYDILADMEGEV